MDNPDVMLEVTVNDSTATMSYKVLSREKDESRAAIEFIQIIHEIFGSCEEEDDDFTTQTSG